MSRAEEIAAKAARLRGLSTPVPTEVSTSVPTEVRGSVPTEVRPQTPRTKPVRATVDMSPAMHVALLQLRQELTVTVSPQVSGQDIWRSALRRVLDDPAAREQLERDLAAQYPRWLPFCDPFPWSHNF